MWLSGIYLPDMHDGWNSIHGTVKRKKKCGKKSYRSEESVYKNVDLVSDLSLEYILKALDF